MSINNLEMKERGWLKKTLNRLTGLSDAEYEADRNNCNTLSKLTDLRWTPSVISFGWEGSYSKPVYCTPLMPANHAVIYAKQINHRVFGLPIPKKFEDAHDHRLGYNAEESGWLELHEVGIRSGLCRISIDKNVVEEHARFNLEFDPAEYKKACQDALQQLADEAAAADARAPRISTLKLSR